MRKSLIGLVLALSLASLPAFSANTPKAGSACSKKGVTKTYKGKEFKCLKKGRKLVWSKGKVVKNETSVAAPEVTPNVAPNPTPTPTPIPIPTPTPTPTPTMNTPRGFDDLEVNFSSVAYGAWKRAQEKIQSAPTRAIPIDLLLGPNTTLNNRNPEMAISQTYKLFWGTTLPQRIVFLAFSFQDRDWAVMQMDKIVPNSGSGWIKDVACPRQDFCVGGGSFYNKSNKTNLIIIATGLDPNNLSNSFSGTLEAHEFTHSLQQSSSDAARPPVNLLTSPWPPNWYWEGLAQFSQHASIYSDSFDKYLEYRRKSSAELFMNPIWNAKSIESYFQANLTEEWGTKYPRWRQYDLGAMFVETLVVLRGPDLALELFRESLNGSGFEIAFQKLYGISFREGVSIISRTIALQLGN